MTTPPKKLARVKVRGTCKAGHVTECVSDPGRRTWEGECATEGCDLKVYARRAPVERTPPARKAAKAAASDEPGKRPVKRVTNYGQQPRKRAARAAGKPGDATGAAGAASEEGKPPVPGDGGGDGSGGGAGSAVVEQPEGAPAGPRRGVLAGLRARRQARPVDRPEYGFRWPWE